ncbi:MAG: class I tRNA ligase family protein [bacterium]|nr:hypothetical protein [Gammaproteobacteria bacterium]HIL97970.1 hypothetical protein [Pseudomonadales bacterium]
MNIYLTTPIYYASGSPHLGHAHTSFLADCYKQSVFLRQIGVIVETLGHKSGDFCIFTMLGFLHSSLIERFLLPEN